MSPALPEGRLDEMREAVFFDGPDAASKASRFWILLVLAALIAAAGVVGDSTATVIGAMIVAPLMVPIQGTMLAVVTGDRANLLRSLALVLAGAALAVAIGYVLGLTVVGDVVAQTNGQVAGRVSPRLIDLLAALATGIVGSVALVRRDISDTLPGVAIAISLVPPLSVVGLTLESGATAEARGALLLFVTNVAAILAMGTLVMVLYGVHRLGIDPSDRRRSLHRAEAIGLIVAMVLAVGIPLTLSSVSIARSQTAEAQVRAAATEWAEPRHWDVRSVDTEAGTVVVRLEGVPPIPSVGALRTLVAERGVDPDTVRVEFVPKETVDLGD